MFYFIESATIINVFARLGILSGGRGGLWKEYSLYACDNDEKDGRLLAQSFFCGCHHLVQSLLIRYQNSISTILALNLSANSFEQTGPWPLRFLKARTWKKHAVKIPGVFALPPGLDLGLPTWDPSSSRWVSSRPQGWQPWVSKLGN
jgi:hypothetical protein